MTEMMDLEIAINLGKARWVHMPLKVNGSVAENIRGFMDEIRGNIEMEKYWNQ
jgi:hypothetical protein